LKEGEGIPPKACSACGWEFDVWMSSSFLSEEGIKTALHFHSWLYKRAAQVCLILGHNNEHLSFEDVDPDSSDTSFTTEWDQPLCSRGCCGIEHVVEHVPFHYLWMEDEEILVEERKKREEADHQKKEKERLEALAEAEAAVKRAEANAQSAQAIADAALLRSREALARLQ
jgi:hypothetical protein